MSSDDFDELAALESHLSAMLARRNQLDLLIANVETIRAAKGEMIMRTWKIEGFKRSWWMKMSRSMAGR